MDIRYSASPNDVKRYTTEELRREFLITGLYQPNEVKGVYSHVDRMVVLGVMPTTETVSLDKGIDIWHSFGTEFFLERREIGIFNIGGEGEITVGGSVCRLSRKDCLYITKGERNVAFRSLSPDSPAKFYGVSAPAHTSYETKLLTIAQAAKKPLGSTELSNRRVINQFIHPEVLKTCQLSMGLTVLEPGSVWNTMPPHTHERRMEVYTYFDIPKDGVVMHFMGQPNETRHIVMNEEDAVISPSWSIHSGVGTGAYAFIWAMGGENQAFDDMDHLQASDLR
ncbi:MAG: 5-dehydro-4-deoxy-D-glucuronate isomerase [Clostridium sp.]|jgi:4-deoxy-L-threo-5-hexosulose-uronate ketol-isomerase|nr:5-dehydro-4-deoxy-D-glucuronate isomerase [Clostridium sp.]